MRGLLYDSITIYSDKVGYTLKGLIMVDVIDVGGGDTSGNINIWNDDKNKKNRSCITIHLNGQTGFISAEGIRIGALFIGSKGDVKKTHFKGDFEMEGRIFARQRITAYSDIFAYKMQIDQTPQDANGDALILGPTNASNLRLGYHQNYSWIQSHGAKPLAINPIGNNVGIGTSNPQARLHVAGDIKCSGDITLLGADCAEEFEVEDGDSIDPGTVMVMNNNRKLQPCQKPYDKRVVGIIAGAGRYRPGIVLDYKKDCGQRLPISINGKANCWADASYSPIEIGDLLTTSSTLGHAMNANDSPRTLGSVIGKALSPLEKGKGMIDVLVTLQ